MDIIWKPDMDTEKWDLSLTAQGKNRVCMHGEKNTRV